MEIARQIVGDEVEMAEVADPIEGDIFVATDTQKIFRFNGTDWVDLNVEWPESDINIQISNIRIVETTNVNANVA